MITIHSKINANVIRNAWKDVSTPTRKAEKAKAAMLAYADKMSGRK